MSQRGCKEADIFPDDIEGTIFFLIPALKGQINKVLIKAKLSHFVRPHQRAHPLLSVSQIVLLNSHCCGKSISLFVM